MKFRLILIVEIIVVIGAVIFGINYLKEKNAYAQVGEVCTTIEGGRNQVGTALKLCAKGLTCYSNEQTTHPTFRCIKE